MELITIKRAREITGGLGKPSKMPGLSYGTSADDCVTGSKLALIPGTPCFNCYAKKSNYQYPSVKMAHKKRKNAYKKTDFVMAMVTLLKKEKFFRWKDSGDVSSIGEFEKIIAVCNATPWVRHWLPTQERSMYRSVKNKIPKNLVVRISSTKIDQLQDRFPQTSMVTKNPSQLPSHVFLCPSRDQGNECLDCRRCWNQSIKHIAYHAH